MNLKTVRAQVVVLLLGLAVPGTGSAQDTLSPALRHDVVRLEETWRVLDQVAIDVWPGWSDFSNVPFLFAYPDGKEMLVGHPNPPVGFALVRGIEPRGKKVYLKDNESIAMDLRPPLMGGGGPIPFGSQADKPVETVMIHLSAPSHESLPKDFSRASTESETQILIYLHELYHCYQARVHTWQYGNLRYNTDENYATYAEVEGLALERAFVESDTNRTREYLRDFIVARQQKRRSMDSTEQLQESEEEVIEGLATYAEIRTLELIKSNPGYGKMIADDPFYFAFADIDTLIRKKVDMLCSARENTMNAIVKVYPFGGFQGVVLDRIDPGWKEGFYERKETLDGHIRMMLNMTGQEQRSVADGLESRYDVSGIRAQHSRLINERDHAFDIINARRGRAFIISFKKTHEFPGARARGTYYSLGLRQAYPDGIERLELEDVVFEGKKSPMTLDQLYYITWVDTCSNPGEKGYTLDFSRREGDTIYRNAVISTRGFTLKAPRIELVESRNRVKITILSKLNEQ